MSSFVQIRWGENQQGLEKEDIPLVEMTSIYVNFNQWNIFFCSNPVGSSEVEFRL